ncbi:hypothetical protein GQ457_13G029430 [Hibiscus cannabinus]
MGIEVNPLCRLCGSDVETRSHLFFGCPYSIEVWQHILHLCRIARSVNGWDVEFRWAVASFRGKSLITFILKLAWNSYIYLIWEERNFRQFHNLARGEILLMYSFVWIGGLQFNSCYYCIW